MHIADPGQRHISRGQCYCGGSMGIATGAALSAKRLGKSDVTVCFFGDGATAQGLLYEVMNMAALWNLPVIYACENNGYSEYTRTDEIAAGSITARAECFRHRKPPPFGRTGCALPSTSWPRIWVAAPARAKARSSSNLMTYRYHGHHVGESIFRTISRR